MGYLFMLGNWIFWAIVITYIMPVITEKSPSNIITYMITRPHQGEKHPQLNDFRKYCRNNVRLSNLSSSSLLLKKPWKPWEDWGKRLHARIGMGTRLYFTCTQVKAWDSGKVCLSSWWGWILFLKCPYLLFCFLWLQIINCLIQFRWEHFLSSNFFLSPSSQVFSLRRRWESGN